MLTLRKTNLTRLYAIFFTFIVMAMPFGVASAQTTTTTDDGAGAIIIVIYALCCLVGFAISIGLTVWTYNDANKRGASGVMWALIVFFFGLLGFIIYLVARPKN